MTVQETTEAMARQAISAWLIDWISKEIEMPAGDIDTGHSLLQYSMSSVTATILVGDLEDRLDLRLSPTLVWDYPSIDAMTDFLVDEAERQARPAATAALAGAGGDAAALLDNIDALSDEQVEAFLRQLSADGAER